MFVNIDLFVNIGEIRLHLSYRVTRDDRLELCAAKTCDPPTVHPIELITHQLPLTCLLLQKIKNK